MRRHDQIEQDGIGESRCGEAERSRNQAAPQQTSQNLLGDVYLDRQQFAEAERIFRQAMAIDVATLSAEHPSLAMDRIRLGRALLRQRRAAEAKTLAGYELLRKQV